MRALLLVLVAAGCAPASTTPTPATAADVPATAADVPDEPGDDEPEALATEPAEARALLDALNAWCLAQGDECDVAERPDAHPDRVAHGETNGWIADHRERLRAHGVEVEWSAARGRFLTQVEADVLRVIGSGFSTVHEEYDTVRSRARARPAVYLGTLVATASTFEPDELLSARIHRLLGMLRTVAPREVASAAYAIIPIYEAVASSDPSRARTASARADGMRALAGECSY